MMILIGPEEVYLRTGTNALRTWSGLGAMGSEERAPQTKIY